MSLTKIAQIDVGATSISSIDFVGIPQNFTDLQLVTSLRSSAGSIVDDILMTLNASSANFSIRRLYGRGDTTYATNTSPSNSAGMASELGGNTNMYGSTLTYISNYSNSITKSILTDYVTEHSNSGTALAYIGINAQSWAGAAAVNRITLTSIDAGNWVQGSSATLYGIDRTQSLGKPKAIGGVISYSNNRWFHTFTSSGTFSTKEPLNIDALIVGAGGGGGAYDGGGGGAGGYQTLSTSLNTIGNYSVTVGAGGPGGIYYSPGRNGAPSNFLTITSIGGGGGGSAMTYQGAGETGNAGASGGGARGGRGGGNTGGSGTAGQGNAGGSSASASGYGAGGGGGAGAAGGSGTTSANGSGGVGLQWIDGNYYAGGGGGCVTTAYGIGTAGAGGIGGGGAGGTPPVAGTANTGGGGGGNRDSTPGATGGSGIIIISYPAN